ncbi:MAG: outer membrane protein assembly factor BamE [Pseudomonadota bacterium]
MKTTLVSVPLLLVLSLVGCSGWSNPIAQLSPHHIEVQQGNLVTQDMVARLKPGMTQSQVRFLLGTPLIVDPFHAHRWDYAYSISKGGQVLERRRVTLRFESDRLKSIEGDIVAAEAPRQEPAKP